MIVVALVTSLPSQWHSVHRGILCEDILSPMQRMSPARRTVSTSVDTEIYPVRVTFQQIYMRDKIMRKKKPLSSIPKFATIFINPDEPPEIRRNKGFRRVAAKVRLDVKDVLYREEWIKIDETTYAASEITKIPAAYLPEDLNVKSSTQRLPDQTQIPGLAITARLENMQQPTARQILMSKSD